MANPYTDNMDLDEVMLKTEDSTSDVHDFYKNESRNQSRKSQRRNSSLKLICVDKVQNSGQKEYSDTKTEEATKELKRKVSEKQLKRQSQKAMITKAAKKHSRQNSKISLLSSEDVDSNFYEPLPMQISNTIGGPVPDADVYCT